MARRMPTLLGRSFEGRSGRIVLPRGLADRGAHHDLEDLVLAEAGLPRRRDVFVGDPVSVLGYLIDQSTQRLAEPGVVERGAALSERCLAVSFENPREQRSTPLRDIRHSPSLLTIRWMRASTTRAPEACRAGPARSRRRNPLRA